MKINNFLVSLGSKLDSLTNHFVFEGYRALSEALATPLGSLIVLYIVLMGYAIAQGLVDKPHKELFKFAIRAGLIYMFAMNWDNFSFYIKDLFLVGSESLANKLMQAVHSNVHGSSLNQGLQQVLNEILQLGSDVFDKGSYKHLSPYFTGYWVILIGSIIIGFAFTEMVVIKLLLSITLCTAPLFIIFTLFKETKSFFERWIGTLAGLAFALIYASAVVGLCFHLLNWVTKSVIAEGSLTAAIWVPFFIVGILCVLVLWSVIAIGKNIGGAVCMSSGAAMIGGFIGATFGAWNSTKRPLQKSLQMGRSGLSGVSNLIQQGGDRGKALFQQVQKNLRRGG